MSWDEWIEQEWERITTADLVRQLRPVAEAVQTRCVREGQSLLNFSSNNYLGLAGHSAVIEAMQQATRRGAGATASRLIIGHGEETTRLEEELAQFKGAESALVLGSGYLANAGILSAFLTKQDAVFSDQLNHASIIDGIRLSGAHAYRYRHGDMDHLEKLLQMAEEKGHKKKLIVTDSVFSMDGDVAPLREIVALKERYGAALMVDEAHGVGVLGATGGGLAEELGLTGQVELQMGTCSKALGVYGAYVAGKTSWIRHLVNTCRSLIYTTALPPAIISGNRAALQLVRAGEDLRCDLTRKSEWFRAELQWAGFDLAGSTTQIIPVVVGDSATSLHMSQALVEQGILAVAIRPPTVAVGKARLRFSLMATHEEDDLEWTVQVIINTGKKLGVI